jgi:hypothetical protein
MMKKVEVNIMFNQFPNYDESKFTIDYKEICSNDLKQYCKSENVMLSSLKYATKTKGTMKFRMELATCHLLQCIYNWLSVVINRLTADIEQNGKVHGQIS